MIPRESEIQEVRSLLRRMLRGASVRERELAARGFADKLLAFNDDCCGCGWVGMVADEIGEAAK